MHKEHRVAADRAEIRKRATRNAHAEPHAANVDDQRIVGARLYFASECCDNFREILAKVPSRVSVQCESDATSELATKALLNLRKVAFLPPSSLILHPFKSRTVRVADCHRKRVRGIVGLRDRIEL